MRLIPIKYFEKEGYEVSKLGYVERNGIAVPSHIGSGGHTYSALMKDGNQYLVKISRLVADAFIEKPFPEAVKVKHLDGDKSNNFHKNLDWVVPGYVEDVV